jgi:hypothetical protein
MNGRIAWVFIRKSNVFKSWIPDRVYEPKKQLSMSDELFLNIVNVKVSINIELYISFKIFFVYKLAAKSMQILRPTSQPGDKAAQFSW